MVPKTAKERFEIVSKFIGFGNPHAPIWFIGIEEGKPWDKDPDKDQEQYDKYARRWFPAESGEIKTQAERDGRSYTKIYDIMSKLIMLINPTGQDLAEWKNFRNEKLLRADGMAFQSNLFPLGKPSDDGEWPLYYKDLFGYGNENRDEYERIVKAERFPLLRSEWKNHAPKITVCFGSKRRNYFEDLLTPSGQCEAFNNCKVYEKSGIVLTPFFKPTDMPDSLIHKLAEKLRPFYARS
ncbi:MAG: hypothetical protein H8K07_13165 [Nitrospira sp.]|nr:hypothetical protein [Nitrospira sp.]